MSNKRNKAARKKVAGEKRQEQKKEQRKPQGDQPPKIDPKRVKATLQHVNNALNIALQNTQGLREETASNIKQVWENQGELRDGLSASEYNLRAHQKVLNAIAIEMDNITSLLGTICGDLNSLVGKSGDEEVSMYKSVSMVELQMADVQIPPAEEGEEPMVVRRIDWPYYHQQVDKDLAILTKLEQEAAEERKKRTAAVITAIDKLREQCTEPSLKDLADRIEKGEKILKDDDLKEFELDESARKAVASRLRAGPIDPKEEPEEELSEEMEAELDKMVEAAGDSGNDPELVREEAKRLLLQSKKVANELGKMKRGEPYDKEIIAEAQQMIDEDEAKEDGDIPEGATVFGG